MTYVFVYGTLKRGRGNHRVLGHSKFITNGNTLHQYTMYNGGFPYVGDGGENSIVGELYEIDDERTLYNLDSLEGVPHHYVRHDTSIKGDDGKDYMAIMYVMAERTKEYISEGRALVPVIDGKQEW